MLLSLIVDFVEHPIRFPSKQTSRYDMHSELFEVEGCWSLTSCERYEFGAANTSMVSFCRFGQPTKKAQKQVLPLHRSFHRKRMVSNGLDEINGDSVTTVILRWITTTKSSASARLELYMCMRLNHGYGWLISQKLRRWNANSNGLSNYTAAIFPA